MNDENKDTKVSTNKGKRITVESDDGEKKFEIEIIEDNAVFKKDEKNEKADVKAKVKVFEKKDGKFPKDATKDEGEKTIKVNYNKGTMWSSLEVTEVNGVKVKSGKTFGGSYHWPFWTTVIVGTVLIIAGIVWWIMASRKEDKEEGDL